DRTHKLVAPFAAAAKNAIRRPSGEIARLYRTKDVEGGASRERRNGCRSGAPADIFQRAKLSHATNPSNTAPSAQPTPANFLGLGMTAFVTVLASAAHFSSLPRSRNV